MQDLKHAVGSGGKEIEMNATATQMPTTRVTGVSASIFAMVIGIAIIAITGYLQSDALHAAAHDVRHATGFPCH